ncbi:ATP-binding cassette domain-containing protein [Bacillus kwashiorkori]|uniref:ATP-binding cassette domain-containing protein n=1 Tax=Bacillus kwashiorkori TaxID=1522318 RepID=UPI00078481BF|nr:ATP-binding cassette domain-containing protein [Bacillus kwashiorkori]
MDTILQIEGLSKKINGQLLLNNIEMKISTPGIYGIVGRNGSGKSLLFKTIAGLLVPTEGKIKVFDQYLEKGAFPKSFGAVLDTGGFLPHYSGFQNLKLLSSIKNLITEKEIREVLDFVGLRSAGNKKVRNYSLGMKQRLSIAQAIMEKPKLLILDEALNGLDEAGVDFFRKVFLDLKNKGTTILLASHNREDIELLCDEIYKMDNGVLKMSS